MSWRDDPIVGDEEVVGWQSDPIAEPEENVFEQALIGLGSGMNRLGQGVGQLGMDIGALTGLVDQQAADQSRADIQAEREFYEQTPVGQSTVGQVGQFAGEVLPTMLVPGGVAGGLGKRMFTGGLSGAALGATSVDDRMQDMAFGGLTGGAAPAVFKGLEMTGVLDKLNLFTKSIDEIRENRALNEVAKDHGVNLMNADYGNQTMMNLETANPGIMQALRTEQQGQVREAAGRVVNDYKNRLGSSPYRTEDLLINEVATNGPSANKATQILQDMQAAGDDDWAAIAQVSGNSQAVANKIEATKRYQNVSELASGAGAVPIPQTRQVVARGLAEAKDSIVPDPTLIRQLEVLDDGLAQPRNYNALRLARSDVGDMVGDSMRGVNQIVGQRGTRTLQQVKSAIEDDLREFSEKQGGALAKAQSEADGFYREYVVPYKDTKLANALSGADPDEAVKAMLKRGPQKHRAERFYNALDQRGRDAVRYGVLDNAYVKSFDIDTGTFSPAKFKRELAANQGVYELAFKGKDREVLDGFRNLMKATERAGQIGFDPKTGAALGNMISRASNTGVGAIVGGEGGAVIGALAQPLLKTPITKWMLTEPRALALVREAAHNDPSAVWRQLQMLMTRSAIQSATEEE